MQGLHLHPNTRNGRYTRHSSCAICQLLQMLQALPSDCTLLPGFRHNITSTISEYMCSILDCSACIPLPSYLFRLTIGIHPARMRLGTARRRCGHSLHMRQVVRPNVNVNCLLSNQLMQRKHSYFNKLSVLYSYIVQGIKPLYRDLSLRFKCKPFHISISTSQPAQIPPKSQPPPSERATVSTQSCYRRFFQPLWC